MKRVHHLTFVWTKKKKKFQESSKNQMKCTTDSLTHMVGKLGYNLSLKQQEQDLLFAHGLLVASLDPKYPATPLSKHGLV